METASASRILIAGRLFLISIASMVFLANVLFGTPKMRISNSFQILNFQIFSNFRISNFGVVSSRCFITRCLAKKVS